MSSQKKWSNWIDMWDELIATGHSIVLKNSSPALVQEMWDEYRMLDLVKTAPHDISLSSPKKDQTQIVMICYCCKKPR